MRLQKNYSNILLNTHVELCDLCAFMSSVALAKDDALKN